MAKYSLKLRSEPIEIEDLSGVENTYYLKELTGSERNNFLTSQAKRAKGKDKDVKDFTGACSELLTLCLYDPQNRLVPAKEIDSWPSEMQMDLFLKAITLSGLDKKGEDDAKNS